MTENLEAASEYLRICHLPRDLSHENVFEATGIGNPLIDLLREKKCKVLQSVTAEQQIDGRFRILPKHPGDPIKFDRILMDFVSIHPHLWSDQIGSIRDALSEGGTAYLEFPVSGTLFESRWIPTLIDKTISLTPSYRLIRDTVLRGFAVRELGSMTPPLRMRRSMIFACRRLAPVALFVGGESGAGKTTLSSHLASETSRVLHFDFILHELASLASRSQEPDTIDLFKNFNFSAIGSSVDEIIASGKSQLLASVIAAAFSPADAVTIAEGYVFHRVEIKSEVLSNLVSRGFRTYSILKDVS